MNIRWKPYILDFKFAAGTSRGVLQNKKSYFIFIQHDNIIGIGESSLINGLSIDAVPGYETYLDYLCYLLNSLEVDTILSDFAKDFSRNGLFLTSILKDKLSTSYSEMIFRKLKQFPSLEFGLETALLDFYNGGKFQLFQTEFVNGKKKIPINGLVWMGERKFMEQQIKEKIENGFACIKLKVGAIDFETELDILSSIRKNFSPTQIEIRLDANGAFDESIALEKLKRLSDYSIHSIEQPIKQGNWDSMAELCKKSPIQIALDEELIAIPDEEEKLKMLQHIKPHYIILKPSLLGGFKQSDNWIKCAKKLNIGWWVTSALESNVGLNAIAQWVSSYEIDMPQGLGTGQLYHNNINSPLTVLNGHLIYDPGKSWNTKNIL